MADDKHYVPGDFYRICDRTGFKVRAGKTRREWNNLIVRDPSWESRQPQDFVRGVADDQSVPQPRPRQTDVFLGPLTTTLTSTVATHSQTLPVVSSVRMTVGDHMNVILDDGTTFRCNIQSIPDAVTITVLPALSWTASSGRLVIDLDAVAEADIG